MSKRSKYATVGALTACVALTVLGRAQAQSSTSPEQERAAIIKALQQRLPGTSPVDWVLGADGLPGNRGGSVVAIPFTTDNSTNSADILAIGKKRWERKFEDGKSLAYCFPNGGKRIAATYPQFDSKTKQVVTLEGAINRCLRLHDEPEIAYTNIAVIGPIAAYLKSLSDGQKLAVRVSSPAAREKFDAGRALFQKRIGQQNFACTSCHVQYAGELYATRRLSPVVGQAGIWPSLEPGGSLRSLQMQFLHCLQKSGAISFELASEELNNLEYYHAFLSNELPVNALTVRR